MDWPRGSLACTQLTLMHPEKKIVYNFGFAKCNRVKYTGDILQTAVSACPVHLDLKPSLWLQEALSGTFLY